MSDDKPKYSKRGVHLVKPGSYGTVWVAGEKAMATYCGLVVERDDVNYHALDQVTCATCKAKYKREQQQQ